MDLQIKFGSVKLAKIYMKRVAMELQTKGTSDKDSSLDYMLLQGVRFAFRIHQVLFCLGCHLILCLKHTQRGLLYTLIPAK